LRKLSQVEEAVKIAAAKFDCDSFVQSIFKDKDGGLGKWIAGGVQGGAFCLEGGCDLPVQMGPVPTTLSVKAGVCLPWLEYANLDGYEQVGGGGTIVDYTTLQLPWPLLSSALQRPLPTYPRGATVESVSLGA
jgi:hypothetical protein